MTHIKTVKVTNPKNVLVQLPGHIVSKWGLKQGDSLEVLADDNEETITVRPRCGYVVVRPGGDADKEG